MATLPNLKSPDATPAPMRVFAAVLWAAMIFALSSIPREDDGEKAWPDVPHADKVTHLVLYAGLGLLVFVTRSSSPSQPGFAWVAAAAAIAAVYGITDELHQVWVPGRTPSTIDWAFDAAGAATGAIVGAWCVRRNRTAGRSMESCELSDIA